MEQAAGKVLQLKSEKTVSLIGTKAQSCSKDAIDRDEALGRVCAVAVGAAGRELGGGVFVYRRLLFAWVAEAGDGFSELLHGGAVGGGRESRSAELLRLDMVFAADELRGN